MSKNNIFLKDVDVPEIVQKKADLAFLSVQMEGRKTMKKGYYKFVIAAAVCAALVVARMFTLRVQAAELEAGHPVPLVYQKNILYTLRNNISSGRSTETYRQCLGSHIEYPGGTLGG